MWIKHVAIGIKLAWNIRNYRYVGDVSSIPKLSSTRPRVGKTITTNNFWGDMLSHNLDHNIVRHVSWDQIIQSKGLQMILTKR